MSLAGKVAELLIDLEAHLRQLDLWQQQAPAAQALASTQPFCIDTLNFAQWLQFVFLPSLYGLIDNGHQLPTQCSIAPMGEEYFRGQGLPSERLVKTLLSIDRLLDGSA